jgi:hypothetical protein
VEAEITAAIVIFHIATRPYLSVFGAKKFNPLAIACHSQCGASGTQCQAPDRQSESGGHRQEFARVDVVHLCSDALLILNSITNIPLATCLSQPADQCESSPATTVRMCGGPTAEPHLDECILVAQNDGTLFGIYYSARKR